VRSYLDLYRFDISVVRCLGVTFFRTKCICYCCWWYI